MESYAELKDRQRKEFENLPIFWAFSKAQLAEGLKDFGLYETETDQLRNLGGGGYCRKSDTHLIIDIMQRHDKELKESIAGDTTGEGFIFGMFDQELANHEYVVTYDTTDALRALGITVDEIESTPAMKYGLKLAMRAQTE